MVNAGIPSGQTGVSTDICGVSVAGFGQLFDSRGQLLAPVVLGGGVPDVLLWLTQGRGWIDRYEFIVDAEQEVARMKVTVKQDRLLLRTLAAPNGIDKGDHCVVVAAQQWV